MVKSKAWEQVTEVNGYYHKYNGLKFRIAYALFLLKKPQDTKQLAEFLNYPTKRVASALSHYKSTGSPYFQRIRKFRGATNHDVNWRLTNSGVNFLANCVYNINLDLYLNFKRNPPQVKVKNRRVLCGIIDKMMFDKEQYSKLFGINKQGCEELGLELKDVLDKIPTANVKGKEVCM
jgi:hypothetical protein